MINFLPPGIRIKIRANLKPQIHIIIYGDPKNLNIKWITVPFNAEGFSVVSKNFGGIAKNYRNQSINNNQHMLWLERNYLKQQTTSFKKQP